MNIEESLIKNSKVIFLEGYVLLNQIPNKPSEGLTTGQEVILKALEIARRSSVQIAFTLSEKFVVLINKKFILDNFNKDDIVFANESEARALVEGENLDNQEIDTVLMKFFEIFPKGVVTLGSKGSIINKGDENRVQPFLVESYPCSPIDLTGAGDMFSGVFLSAINMGYDKEVACSVANYFASKVIQVFGSRLRDDVFRDFLRDK